MPKNALSIVWLTLLLLSACGDEVSHPQLENATEQTAPGPGSSAPMAGPPLQARTVIPVVFENMLNGWNGISWSLSDENRLVEVSTRECLYGTCGFNVDKSQRLNTPFNHGSKDYSHICVSIAAIPESKSLVDSRLLKFEVNDVALLAEDQDWQNPHDTAYLNNRAGRVCFDLGPVSASPLVKMQFVFWRTEFSGLKLRAWFVNMAE